MLSGAQIVAASAAAAAKAARLHKRPFIVEQTDLDAAKAALHAGEIPRILRLFPFVGGYVAPGWKLIGTLFADATGWGDEYEPALTVSQLVARLKVGHGYAIIEAGEFQVYIGEFERVQAQEGAA